jgi:hypothetical protein
VVWCDRVDCREEIDKARESARQETQGADETL